VVFDLQPEVSRERVSIYAELRFLTWAGVMLIAAGVAGIVAKHLDEIGPTVIAASIFLSSIACYAWCFWRRRRAQTSLIDDYILLLAALLASAGIGYIENWQPHFLLLAALHAAVAYFFDSRLVLSLAISALAAYFGVERRHAFFWDSSANAARALTCAALVFGWRFADALRRRTTFTRVFDHFATNLAFWGALSLLSESTTRIAGCLLAIVFAIASAVFGVRAREEPFVIYAWIYGMIALDVLIVDKMRNETLILFYLVLSTIAAIVALFRTHALMRSDA
jgi:predicted membrane protein DUF2157